LKKHLVAILLFTGLAFSQVAEEEHQLVKNTLVDMTIRWNLAVRDNESLSKQIEVLVQELQAIEKPSEELIAIMKKYGIYQEEIINN